MAAISFVANQKVLLTAQALDSAGVQVAFTAPPTFSSSDLSVATLVALSGSDPAPAAGQYAMWVVGQKAGSVTVTVSSLAVASDPTTKLTATLDFTLTAAPVIAATIHLSAGNPTHQSATQEITGVDSPGERKASGPRSDRLEPRAVVIDPR